MPIGRMEKVTLRQPERIVFGRGCLRDAVEYLKQLKPAHLRIVTSPSVREVAEHVRGELAEAGVAVSVDGGIPPEPTIEAFYAAREGATAAGATCVLGLGGGSVLDVAKLVAALVDGMQTLDEVFGIGLLRGRSCGLVCVPTTAGTGSEVSPNAVLLDDAAKLKKAVISPFLVPDATFVDPELTASMPPAITAATGLDALAHCVESYTSKFAHPVVDVYALKGIELAGRFLRRAVADGQDMEAREGMALASLYGGLCLGPVNTAGGHALAYPLGSEYHMAHGVSVALLAPHVFRFNAETTPERHAEVAAALGVTANGDARDRALRGADELTRLTKDCGVETDLRLHGVESDAIPALAASAMKVTRLLKNNPRDVSEADCVRIYESCFAG